MRRPTKAAESAAINREHLTRLLLEQMDRTYGTEGHAGLTRMIAELLGRLDDSALRAYTLSLGLASEDDLEPQEDDTGPASTAEETS